MTEYPPIAGIEKTSVTPGKRIPIRLLLIMRLLALTGLCGAFLLIGEARHAPLGAEEVSPAQQALLERGIIPAESSLSLDGSQPLSREEQIVLLARFHAYVFFRLALDDKQTTFDDIFKNAQSIVESDNPQLNTLHHWGHEPTAGRLTLPPEYQVPATNWAYPAACYLRVQLEKNWSPTDLLPLQGLSRDEAANKAYELVLRLEASPIGKHPFNRTSRSWTTLPSPSQQVEEEQPAIVQVTKGNPIGEWGDPQAPTKVVGYVPDSFCHDGCVAYLVSEAQSYPTELYVKLVRMFTPEGQELMGKEGRAICATYEINGKNSFISTAPDGSTRKAIFKMSPQSGGTYTVEDLKAAVEQALQEARDKAQSERGGNP